MLALESMIKRAMAWIMDTYSATRFAAGRNNYNWFEANGSKGSVVFNLETMNELLYYNTGDPDDRLGSSGTQAAQEGLQSAISLPLET